MPAGLTGAWPDGRSRGSSPRAHSQLSITTTPLDCCSSWPLRHRDPAIHLLPLWSYLQRRIKHKRLLLHDVSFAHATTN
jgi:hypothetical protein